MAPGLWTIYDASANAPIQVAVPPDTFRIAGAVARGVIATIASAHDGVARMRACQTALGIAPGATP